MRTTLASVPDVVSAGSWSAHTGHNVALDSLLREIMVRHELNRRGLVSGHRFFFFCPQEHVFPSPQSLDVLEDVCNIVSLLQCTYPYAHPTAVGMGAQSLKGTFNLLDT